MAGALRILALAVLGSGLVHAGPAAAQSSVEFTVSGNSTIRGWTCTVAGDAEITEGSGAPAPGLSDGVQAVTLTVHVPDFQCPEDEMREHLLEAMRAEEFPEIRFSLDGYQVSGQTAATTGQLTILDTTRPVNVPLTVTAAGSGARIEGELPLDMTDYGVEPPAVFLGLLVVRPQIRIQFSGTVMP